ncbi:MAG: AAA family ATPase [Phycisphaerae bacterium]|nr:AAA family ATPase [Phycisphaerae bacterium]
MITSVHIENFKCFKNFDIELGPFNVLIGPNDSGKTAFLQAIQLVGLVSDANLTEFTPISKVQNDFVILGIDPIDNWPWQCDKENAVRIEMKADAMDVPEDCRRAFAAIKMTNKTIMGSEELQNNHKGSKSQNWNRNAIGQIDYFHFNPAALRKPTRSTAAFLSTGDGLPALIDNIRGDIDNFKQFQDEFCSRFPYYKQIGRGFIRHSTPDKDLDLVEIKFTTRSDNVLPAVGVSDGVMLSLAFLALKYARKQPGHHIFLIEEPENGVHPGALKEIRDTLHHLSEQSGIQIILTTHSPYLLDLVEPEEVRVFQKDDEGAVHAVKLSDFPEVEEMRKHFGAGEIWTAFDEKKIVETVRGEK